MLKIIDLDIGEGKVPIFVADEDTGYSGADALFTPGVYQGIDMPSFALRLYEMSGTIGSYVTKGTYLYIEPTSQDSNAFPEVDNITGKIAPYLNVPETAAKMMLAQEDEASASIIESALATIRAYERITNESKLFLPEECFKYFPPDVASKMMAKRQVYTLKNVDNQEIIQKKCTDTYGIVLPNVAELHTTEELEPSVMDILRVIMPYRTTIAKGSYRYNAIYHTPYFKVDRTIRGNVPQAFGPLNGYTKNNTLGIQPNERHMYDNLYTFVCADIAYVVANLVTGVFFNTPFGKLARKVVECKNEELILNLVGSLQTECPEGVTCSLIPSTFQQLFASDWEPRDIVTMVSQNVSFTTDFMSETINSLANNNKIIDTQLLPFVFNLSDSDKELYTTLLIENNIISRPMMDYLVNLCLRAYTVNWGHTGATRAIPCLVSQGAIPKIDKVLASWLAQSLDGVTMAPADVPLLYTTTVVSDSDSDELESSVVAFDYYISADTANMIERDALSVDYFSSAATGAESRDTAIIEYWKHVNGNSNLDLFIKSAFVATGDVHVVLDCFAKLMRWGEVKPAALVLENYPDIKTLFDLSSGLEMKNTMVVDETQLVLINGCRYSWVGVATAEDVLGVGAAPAIVGFILQRDYGDVKKLYLASWVDLGEMVTTKHLDVAEFKVVCNLNIAGDFSVDVLDCFNSGFELLVSNRNSELGVKYNVKPAQLSEIALFDKEGILRSVEYIKSQQNNMIVTLKDRQYHILSDYTDTIRKVYGEVGSALQGESVGSVAFMELLQKFYTYYLAKSDKAVPDVNEVRANQAVSSMVLDLGDGQSRSIEYSNESLQGKFILIHDPDLVAPFRAITFSDARLQNMINKMKINVVLLMLETSDSFLICRKDISAAELKIVVKQGPNGPTKQIEARKYKSPSVNKIQISTIVELLMAGQRSPMIKSETGVSKPVKLHQSVKEGQ